MSLYFKVFIDNAEVQSLLGFGSFYFDSCLVPQFYGNHSIFSLPIRILMLLKVKYKIALASPSSALGSVWGMHTSMMHCTLNQKLHSCIENLM